MAIGNEAVTLKQFKRAVSGGGGGGGGSSPELVVLWEGSTDSSMGFTADREYRFAVVVANGMELYFPWGRSYQLYLGGTSSSFIGVSTSGVDIAVTLFAGDRVTVTKVGVTD